jgi:membrane-bound lytic murein transglycosylase B
MIMKSSGCQLYSATLPVAKKASGRWPGLWAVAVVFWLFALPITSFGSEPDFEGWLVAFKKEALKDGISQATLDAAFKGVKPIEKVVDLDRRQPEFKLTLDQYLSKVVTKEMAEEGRARLAEVYPILSTVMARHGVAPPYLVALWGIESKYGKVSGGYPVIASLATLAYDGRRSTFFRGELLQALRILDEGHIPVADMTGSWAGAMGQLQFMPSTFKRYAADFDGDGRIDIWNNLGDAFLSGGRYLAAAGWVKGQPWGQEVVLPEGLDRALIGMGTRKEAREWASLGIQRSNKSDQGEWPALQASLVQPDGPGGRAFMVYDNFRVILSWNRSQLFGIAVGTLADQIAMADTAKAQGM